VARTVFCPHCRSMQPLGEYQEGDQPALWCQTCGTPIEGAPGARRAAPPRPSTILCIDDDQIVLSVYSDALERHGFRTLVASDGPAGIALAKQERPDLILLDVMLPGMGGFEICRRLRAEPGLRDTPIILLTASTDPDLDSKGREAGATSTLRKPFGPATIVSTVEQVLGRKAAPPKP